MSVEVNIALLTALLLALACPLLATMRSHLWATKAGIPNRVDSGAGLGALILLSLVGAVAWFDIPTLRDLVVGNEAYVALMALLLLVLSGSLFAGLPALIGHRHSDRDERLAAVKLTEPMDRSRSHFKIAAIDRLASKPIDARSSPLDQSGPCPVSPRLGTLKSC